jgi:lysophospholipase L1-like esterase
MRILFFGDSITHGLWDPQGGWVQRLRTVYDKQSLGNIGGEYPDLYNLGISGDVASGVVKRLALEMEMRGWFETPIVVIAIGKNDTMFTKNEQATTVETYAGELKQILAAAKQFTHKVLFVGLTPVDDTLANPWKYAQGNYSFSNERTLEFEKVLRDFCYENKVPFVEVFEALQGRRIEENVLADGLHPNELGHQLIAELVKPKLDELIRQNV